MQPPKKNDPNSPKKKSKKEREAEKKAEQGKGAGTCFSNSGKTFRLSYEFDHSCMPGNKPP
jgi:hypothetical protein